MNLNMDDQIRLAAFNWLTKQTFFMGNVLTYDLIKEGLLFNGQKRHLMGPQGIFKPRQLKLPLSITTSPKSPYKDRYDKDGNLLYSYRGTNPNHQDNVGLRVAMKQKIPLVYFVGLRPGRYEVVYPVFIIEDYIQDLTFKVVADKNATFGKTKQDDIIQDEVRRRYVTREVRVRLHQSKFREKVLFAYQEQCACCRLRHLELLDAAHITPESDPEGDPVVTNGISLCKLHHSAFDSRILGIRPDYLIEVNKEVLEEEDGPMLKHGLQELHNSSLILPRSRNSYPDKERLEMRYEEFRNN